MSDYDILLLRVEHQDAKIARLRARVERLRLELEKIGWMDEFLDADGARAMMNIARNAVNLDESALANEEGK